MAHGMATPGQSKPPVLRNKMLNALFGPGVAAFIAPRARLAGDAGLPSSPPGRGCLHRPLGAAALLVVVIGTLVIILIGLLRPQTPFSSGSHSPSNVGFQVGNEAPNFTLTALDGKLISLSDYRGKPVILNFWYATCPGCLAEMPGMQKFYAAQHAAGKDVVVLGINIVDDAPTARQFVQERGVTYPVVLDQNQQVLTLYRVNVTPTSYFIDRKGIIRVFVPAPLDDATLQTNAARIS
jgi:peroxiredoxin